MGKILVLDQETINQIAAGEVIERPSSVVKELVENAMDAGSTAITVEIRDGGLAFIRVTDNGSGFLREDIALAFLRHSTSKIRGVEDLLCVGSLGFRGEALSSIAAVARVELVTCASGQTVGSRYRIEGGAEIGLEEVGAPEGTTIVVRDLFYNTPVRRKFLKSAATEGAYISDLMQRLALSHPDVSFRLIVNGQTKLHTAGSHNLKDIIYSAFGRDVAANLIPLEAQGSILSVRGYIGKPLIARGNRSYEIYFINGRYIRSNIINKAIEDGYKSFLMQHKYPLTVLHLNVEPEFLDVNVHPTKMELRFRGEQEIYGFLTGAVRDALFGRELIPRAELPEPAAPVQTPDREPLSKAPAGSGAASLSRQEAAPPEPFEARRLEALKRLKSAERARYQERPAGETVMETGTDRKEGNILRETASYQAKGQTAPKQTEQQTEQMDLQIPALEPETETESRTAVPSAKEAVRPAPQAGKGENIAYTQQSLVEDRLMTPEKKKQFRLIGQLFDTYWLLQADREFLIIDQHAAHEKVLYERTMEQLSHESIPAQQLAPPLILTLSSLEMETVENNRAVFERMGFSIEPFGGREYAVYSVPNHLFGIADRDLLMEMIDELSAEGGKATLTLLTERVASASCKAAVKGNSRLSFAEADELLSEHLTLKNPYTCPHGRPVIISMSQYELEKKFKRVL